MLKQFIDQLAKDLQRLEGIQPNEEDVYHLEFDPDLQISLRENPESGITLFTRLGPVPNEKVEEFFLKLMKANLFGKKTGGGILGIDKDGKNVNFRYFFPADRNYKEFHEALEDFVNYAESWQGEILQSAKTGMD
jgi:hypothetical protein